ncbi:MAG: radical SAM protein [Chlorobium sp.]|nr:radical SAM protein [Chlorobium phaeovibrioides]NQU45535.1 radical SAM protein [Chlorobium sp.]
MKPPAPEKTITRSPKATTPAPPFIHKFRTKQHHYIYDVNTNRVFQVNSLVYELADLQDLDSPEAICMQFPEISPDEAELALDELREAAEKGWLSSHRPERLAFSPGKNLKEELADARYQQLILNVTENCNLRCDYCIYSGSYRDQRTHSDRSMNFELAQKALDRFMNNARDRVYISFYGGEPLSRFTVIKKIIRYTEMTFPQKTVNWSLTTNAVLISKEIAHYLMEKKVLLTVSLDGPQAVTDRHRKDTENRGVFARVMRSLELLRQADQETYDTTVQFSIVCAPPFNFAETERFFNENELVRGHQYSFSYMNATGCTPAMKPAQEQIERLNTEESNSRRLFVEDLKNRASEPESPASFAKSLYEKDFSDFYHRPKTPLGNEMYPNGCCTPSAQRLFVSVDGKFHICEKIDNAYPIGNIETGVDHQSVERFFDTYSELSRDCLNCWACRLCSLCFFNFISGGTFSAEHRSSECDYLKKRWDRLLRDYYTLLEQDEHALDHLAKKDRSIK